MRETGSSLAHDVLACTQAQLVAKILRRRLPRSTSLAWFVAARDYNRAWDQSRSAHALLQTVGDAIEPDALIRAGIWILDEIFRAMDRSDLRAVLASMERMHAGTASPQESLSSADFSGTALVARKALISSLRRLARAARTAEETDAARDFVARFLTASGWNAMYWLSNAVLFGSVLGVESAVWRALEAATVHSLGSDAIAIWARECEVRLGDDWRLQLLVERDEDDDAASEFSVENELRYARDYLRISDAIDGTLAARLRLRLPKPCFPSFVRSLTRTLQHEPSP